MASLRTLLTKTRLIKPTPVTSNFLQQNGMSQYPSYYVEPIFKKPAQTELFETGEATKMAHVPTRAALVDQTCSVFHDDLVRLFTNYIMREGNKLLARDILEKAFEKVKRIQIERYHKAKTEEDKMNIILDPKKIFHMAVENCKPTLMLTPIKRGGVRYQVPVPITDRKAQFTSMRWLIQAANDKERTVHFPEKMAHELVDAANNQGRVIKRKQDLHKMCEANRAYAHYRWS